MKFVFVRLSGCVQTGAGCDQNKSIADRSRVRCLRRRRKPGDVESEGNNADGRGERVVVDESDDVEGEGEGDRGVRIQPSSATAGHSPDVPCSSLFSVILNLFGGQ